MDSNTKIPAAWEKSAHESWLRGHRKDAIQKTIDALNRYPLKKPRDLILQLVYYLFLIKDYRSCCVALEQNLKYHVDDIEILQNLAVSYGRCGQYKESVLYGEKVVALDPNNFAAWDGLASSYYRTHQFQKSSQAGTKSLSLKDIKFGNLDQSWSLPSGSPSDYCHGKLNVISFSLWGHQQRYLLGALRNLLLSHDIYPGWQLWFYVDQSVPSDFLALIQQLGGKYILQPNHQNLKQKLCWRFKVANAPEVGYFLVRDVDSVISVREYNAVQQVAQI